MYQQGQDWVHQARLPLADYHMHVAVDDMQITEDVHMAFDHMLYKVLSEELSTF